MRCFFSGFAVLALAGSLLLGCGGGDEGESAKPAGNLKPQDPGGNAAPIQAVAVQANAPLAAKPKQADTPQVAPEPEWNNPNDVFEVAEDSGNFEIAQTAGEADRFLAFVPADGGNSQQLLVQKPALQSSQSGQRNSNFRLPEGFEAVASAGNSEEGFPLRIRCLADNALMALIPAGVFIRGFDGGPSNAAPAHNVFLDAFYIDVHEVTVGQYEAYRTAIREARGRVPAAPLNEKASPDQPAVGMTWGDARGYVRWAGKELPTEAEWEKAARGEKGFEYPWGNDRAVWARLRQREQLDDVGSFRLDESLYGVMDVCGNAAEWCQDLYSETAYEQAVALGGSALRNPQDPKRNTTTNERVVRGNGPRWQVWHREGINMSESSPRIGFRCVLRMAAPAESR